MSSRTLACGDCMEVLAVYEEGQEPGPIIHECKEQTWRNVKLRIAPVEVGSPFLKFLARKQQEKEKRTP